MSDLIEQSLTYNIKVRPDEEYSLRFEIGDNNQGDHHPGFGNVEYSPEPEDNTAVWTAEIGKGEGLAGRSFSVSSYVKESNPNTDYRSSRLYLNDQLLTPEEGEEAVAVLVDNQENVRFIQSISFQNDEE